MASQVHITIEQARKLTCGDVLYSTVLRTARGDRKMYRVTSVKLWKRSPQRVEVRTSHGMFEHMTFDERSLVNLMTQEQYTMEQQRQEAADRNEAMQHLPFRMQQWGWGHMYTSDDRFLRIYKAPQRWLRDNAHLVNEAAILFYRLHEGRPAQEDILVLKCTMSDGRYMFMRWGDVEVCRRFCYRTFADFHMTDAVYTYHRAMHRPTQLAGYYGTDR